MAVFRMPSLGADMDSGTLIEWLVSPGDSVHRGDVVAVVDTAKSAIDVEVFADGVVSELLVEPGTEVPVGTPLATIAEESEPVASPPEPDRPPPPLRHLADVLGVDLHTVAGTGPKGRITRQDVERAAGDAVVQPAAEESTPRPARLQAGSARRVRATPRARRLAASAGIDLAELAAAAGGAVTADDVIRATQAREQAEPETAPAGPSTAATGSPGGGAEPGDDEERRASRRQATAALMGRAAREIPHYYVAQTMDVTHALDRLSSHNAPLPPRQRVLPAVLFLRATAAACVAVPELNGHWVGDAFQPATAVDLGVAVAVRGGGLVTPRIRGAEALGLDELMGALTDVVGRARNGRLRARELLPGSITVSSLADGGPEALYGVIYPPQVAVVGIGGIAERPWAESGMLTVRRTVTVTLGADHRATDGRIGAKFLAAFEKALAETEET